MSGPDVYGGTGQGLRYEGDFRWAGHGTLRLEVGKQTERYGISTECHVFHHGCTEAHVAGARLARLVVKEASISAIVLRRDQTIVVLRFRTAGHRSVSEFDLTVRELLETAADRRLQHLPYFPRTNPDDSFAPYFHEPGTSS